MRNIFNQRRPFMARCRHRRRAMTMIEVAVVVTLTTILCGVAMSLLFGLREWDRDMWKGSVQNEQLVRLGEVMRTDLRKASEVLQPSDEVIALQLPAEQIRYELLAEGCRRTVTHAGESQAAIELFAVGAGKSWTLKPGPSGKRPLFEVAFQRQSKDNETLAATLVVYAAVGADELQNAD